jgi:ABC-2 type transport system permease protein
MSGLYFPLRALGAWGLVLAAMVPLGLGVDGMRQVILGPSARGLLPVWTETAILFALAVVLFVVARAMLDYLERLSKREGRLTQRWQ